MNAEPVDSLTVAVAQMRSVDDLKSNETQIWRHLQQVEQLNTAVDMVSFPENSLYMRIGFKKRIDFLKLDHPVFEKLTKWAVKHQCAIHLGSLPLELENRQSNGGSEFYNGTVLVLPDGQCFSPYQKIHLFDADVEGMGAIRESDRFQPGKTTFIWEFKGWRFGLSICFDLRFAELYSHYRNEGVDCLMVPSSFTVPTGRVHWEILLRARAIESQAFVVAAAQEGLHLSENGDSTSTYGHSLVVGPWGDVLAEAKQASELIVAKLERSEIIKCTRQIPMAKGKKP